jgi:hypothetical protein
LLGRWPISTVTTGRSPSRPLPQSRFFPFDPPVPKRRNLKIERERAAIRPYDGEPTPFMFPLSY